MKKTKRWLTLLLAGLLAVPNAAVLKAEELTDGIAVEEIASEELPEVGDTEVIEVPEQAEIKDIVISPNAGTIMHSGDTFSISFKIAGRQDLPQSFSVVWDDPVYLDEEGRAQSDDSYYYSGIFFTYNSETAQYDVQENTRENVDWINMSSVSYSVDKDTLDFSVSATIKKSKYFKVWFDSVSVNYLDNNARNYQSFGAWYIDDDCAEGNHTILSSTKLTVDKKATCTEPGSQSKHCIKCNSIVEETVEEIPALGHKWYEDYRNEPTCVQDGQITYRCSRCRENKYETIPATGIHTPQEVEEVKPTCNQVGYTKGTRCSICGQILDGCEEIPKVDHDWKEQYRNEPTCGRDGNITYRCSWCWEEKQETLPATGEHKWTEDYRDYNCIDGGFVVYTCYDCWQSKREELPAEGHKWSDWYKADSGFSDDNYIWEERKCSVCGETERRHGDEVCGHDWGAWEQFEDEWDGSFVERKCSICGKRERHYYYEPYLNLYFYDPNYDVFDFSVQLIDSQGKVHSEQHIYANRDNNQMMAEFTTLKPGDTYTLKIINLPDIFLPIPDQTIRFDENYYVDAEKSTINIVNYRASITLEHTNVTPTPTPSTTEIIYVPVTPTPAPVDHEAYIPPIEECSVTGLEEARVYAPGKYFGFEGVGTSAETKYSVRTIGDGMWIPAYWSFDEAGKDRDTRFKLGHDDGIAAGTHDLYVWFRLFKWDGEDWVATATVKSIKTQFAAEEAPTPTPTPEPEPSVTAPKTVITKLEDTGSGNLRIFWRSMEDKVDGYQIRWSTRKDMTGMKTATYTGINNTTRPSLSLGKVYYVGVRTFVMNNGKKVYSEWSGTKAIKLTRTLATPSVSGASQKGTGIQTKWFTVADAEGYQLRFCQDTSFKGARTASVSGQNKTSFTKYGLGSGTWYVAVRAYKTAEDGVRYYSAWSGTQIVELK